MNFRHKEKYKKKLAVKEQRQKIADVFIYQFIMAIALCIITFIDIHLYSRWADIVHNVHFWTLWPSLAIMLTAFIIQLKLKEETARWVIWVKRWAFLLTLGLGLIYIHTNLGRIYKAWWTPVKNFMGFGNESMSLRWMFSYIGVGLLVCFVIYVCKDYKLAVKKRKLKKEKIDVKKKTDKK